MIEPDSSLTSLRPGGFDQMNILIRWSKRRQVMVQVEMAKELMVVTINIPP